MFLLDTDVISQVPKARPNAQVISWLSSIRATDLRICTITIEEIRYGAERLDPGRRRREIEAWLDIDVLSAFAGRILPVDVAVADRCGRLVAAAKRKKHNPSLQDSLIAATALVHGLRLATLNRKHFEPLGIDLVDF